MEIWSLLVEVSIVWPNEETVSLIVDLENIILHNSLISFLILNTSEHSKCFIDIKNLFYDIIILWHLGWLKVDGEV